MATPLPSNKKRGLITVPSIYYNQLQKYLRHCTVFWHKWPVHDHVLVMPPPPLIKVTSNTRPYSKLGGTTLNRREEGGQYYILQTRDQERFEAREVVFPWECLIIFATGCSSNDLLIHGDVLIFPTIYRSNILPKMSLTLFDYGHNVFIIY